MKKIVLTGAAGNLGGVLRAPLAQMCEVLVSTDIAPALDGCQPNETYKPADLGRLDQVEPLLEGADMVVHFGAIGDEAPWDEILNSNIVGAYTVWEAAYRQGVRRVVYASSIHAVGMHPKTDNLDGTERHRPDTYYGLAKCFAEDLASLYWDKRGIESVCMRILSCQPEPANARALGSWLSYPDLIRMVQAAITSPTTGFSIVWGVSHNDRAPVSNTRASFLGYRPQDNAESYAPAILPNAAPMDPQNPEDMCHGGPFAVVPLGESGVAMIKARSVKP
ncbi:3-beta hydroxysteroid dehydrogenase [Loktanella sp. 3ANDIMAR09]|uniref:NAD-dependent epimerase/dehydratase family protein n=1 Tax=Loktanella sp. 3ANDIMAR09 TaxID=1225657 RepID=UPI0006FA899D|nr:NAD(P)-dependent oxidoreductase [Loktanella sp. 3ANDIMAR09]KQI70356.1 3-beta hydroxysteroid dehydrogenase [Loktanella sp. 3ANDIMAR09]